MTTCGFFSALPTSSQSVTSTVAPSCPTTGCTQPSMTQRSSDRCASFPLARRAVSSPRMLSNRLPLMSTRPACIVMAACSPPMNWQSTMSILLPCAMSMRGHVSSSSAGEKMIPSNVTLPLTCRLPSNVTVPDSSARIRSPSPCTSAVPIS
ncbi:hypothetical protein KMAL_29570 [Novacetimonas maltaceti]|uniref:Uncharacterized protein n=1 Tax=Novacetimonas maltaceti TaxID=1203393 RepID=A0A2S3VXT3_9PROT|nr:hypothetical protein KMAL_29570 [Novacetimonas maltaceti]